VNAARRLHIVGGRVLAPTGWMDADLLLQGGVVAGMEERLHADVDATVDAVGLSIVPGFVDLQINGGFGHDFPSAPESIWRVGALLPRTGVTAFVPTIVSSPPFVVRRALEVLAAGPPSDYVGAVPLGLHCEGPMLSPACRGAHAERHLAAPSDTVIAGWSKEAGVRMVTLAPEL
jgi:N-acetylglucosamine-6-phosphate deacetylase